MHHNSHRSWNEYKRLSIHFPLFQFYSFELYIALTTKWFEYDFMIKFSDKQCYALLTSLLAHFFFFSSIHFVTIRCGQNGFLHFHLFHFVRFVVIKMLLVDMNSRKLHFNHNLCVKYFLIWSKWYGQKKTKNKIEVLHLNGSSFALKQYEQFVCECRCLMYIRGTWVCAVCIMWNECIRRKLQRGRFSFNLIA